MDELAFQIFEDTGNVTTENISKCVNLEPSIGHSDGNNRPGRFGEGGGGCYTPPIISEKSHLIYCLGKGVKLTA